MVLRRTNVLSRINHCHIQENQIFAFLRIRHCLQPQKPSLDYKRNLKCISFTQLLLQGILQNNRKTIEISTNVSINCAKLRFVYLMEGTEQKYGTAGSINVLNPGQGISYMAGLM